MEMNVSKLEKALRDHVGYAAGRNAASILTALERQLEAGGENEMPVSVHFRVKREQEELTLAIDDVSWKITKKVVDKDFYSIPVDSAQLELPLGEGEADKEEDLLLPVFAVPARGSLPVMLEEIKESVEVSRKNMESFLDNEEIALVYIANGKWFARRPRRPWVKVDVPLTRETFKATTEAMETGVVVGSGRSTGIWNLSSNAFRRMALWIQKEGSHLYLAGVGARIQYDDAVEMAQRLREDMTDMFLVNPEVLEAGIGYKEDDC